MLSGKWAFIKVTLGLIGPCSALLSNAGCEQGVSAPGHVDRSQITLDWYNVLYSCTLRQQQAVWNVRCIKDGILSKNKLQNTMLCDSSFPFLITSHPRLV